MEKFKALSNQPVSDNEKKISAFWDEIQILNKSIETREGNKQFIFYEGPPTANGHPGIHH
ncbi:MAG: class I tRNA ligase family protein, partial [Clostridia bacterium]|nr:class I tRNA ligase family protein [Clostridia bacterium]